MDAMERTTLETPDDVMPGYSDGSWQSPGAAALIGSALVGAGLMYFLDPDRGARRRNLVVDGINHALHVTGDTAGKTARDLRNRSKGVVAAARSRITADRADAWVIADRVRAELGRVVSHPGAIGVGVDDGTVTLTGPVLADEVEELLSRVRKVRGVDDVLSLLQVHETGDSVPALQGGIPRQGRDVALRQESWTPAARLLASAVGGTLALYGGRRRDPLSMGLGLAGLTLLTRAVTSSSLRRREGRRHGIDVRKTININAPREIVFTFLTDYENWPNFMTHVREVREMSPGLQHWVVDGPAGTTLEWDAEITQFVENEIVSWRSIEGSAVEHSGTMRVDENDDGSTRAQIRMSYMPPAGAAGHAIAVLFRADPKHQLDDDMARLKTTIETGVPPRDAARGDEAPSR